RVAEKLFHYIERTKLHDGQDVRDHRLGRPPAFPPGAPYLAAPRAGYSVEPVRPLARLTPDQFRPGAGQVERLNVGAAGASGARFVVNDQVVQPIVTRGHI